MSEAFAWNLIFICLLIYCATLSKKGIFTVLIFLAAMACMVCGFWPSFR